MNHLKISGSRGSVLSWMLLSIWLVYSAVMLWNMKVTVFGSGSMCHYVPPRE